MTKSQTTLTPTWPSLQSSDETVRQAALTALWEEHRRAMYTLAVALLDDWCDAEDAVQEAFCGFIRALRRIQPQCSPRTYLMRVQRNVCIDFLRKRQSGLRPQALGELDGDVVDRRTGAPDAALVDIECHEHLWQVLGSLSEVDRTAIALKFMIGLKNQQAADVMMMRKNAFQVRVHRALSLLKGRLDQRDL